MQRTGELRVLSLAADPVQRQLCVGSVGFRNGSQQVIQQVDVVGLPRHAAHITRKCHSVLIIWLAMDTPKKFTRPGAAVFLDKDLALFIDADNDPSRRDRLAPADEYANRWQL